MFSPGLSSGPRIARKRRFWRRTPPGKRKTGNGKRGRWRAAAAGVTSGILFALAFPQYELPLLAPLALVPWIVALALEEKRLRGLLSGFLFGMAYWIVSIPWIVYVVTQFGGQSRAMGVLSVIILAAINAEWPTVVGWAVVAVAPPRSTRRRV